MRNFTNPFDNISVAFPCPANWDEMFGDDRKRFCGDCKLNVYNLSDMTRREAENLLINSEGRLCVRFFRRADGTVLTKNCPVGWQAVRQRVSRVATAAFSMAAGIFSGVFAFNILQSRSDSNVGEISIERPTLIQGDVSPVYTNDPYTEVLGGLPADQGEVIVGQRQVPQHVQRKIRRQSK